MARCLYHLTCVYATLADQLAKISDFLVENFPTLAFMTRMLSGNRLMPGTCSSLGLSYLPLLQVVGRFVRLLASLLL